MKKLACFSGMLSIAAACVMLPMGASAAYESQLDKGYSLGDTGDIDHNIMHAPVDASTQSSAAFEPVEVSAPPSVAEKAAEKPTKKNKSVKQAKEVAPIPRDIPLIEMGEATSSSADVTFVTGGIGDDERAAIEAAKEDYNLHITSASISGAFVGEAHVVISRVNGKEAEEVLNAAAGPLLYVHLPVGTYTLDASLGEQHKSQKITITKKTKAVKVGLGWKQTESK